MKTVNVVAAIIIKDKRYLQHKEAMVNLKMAGNFPVEKLRKVKLLKTPL